MKPKSRRKRLDLNFKFLKGHPPGSTLLHYASPIHYVSLLLFVLPAFSISSCAKSSGAEFLTEESVPVDIIVANNALKHIRTLDFLLYKSEDTKKLLAHRRLTLTDNSPRQRLYHFRDSVHICSDYNILAVAIANLPMRLNLSAVDNFGSLELVRMAFSKDDDECPVMSDWGPVDSSGVATLRLKTLMADIIVRSVSNESGTVARGPRVWLENVNYDAEILRTAGFRPVETTDSCSFSILPYDIGTYTQYPGTVLHSYPNDCNDGIGTPGTRLVLEFELGDTTLRYGSTIPPFSRATGISADILIQKDSFCLFELTKLY